MLMRSSTIASTSFGSIGALYSMRAFAIVGNCISFVLAGLGFVPTHASVVGEVDSRHALVATECDAAPRVLECGPEAIDLCNFWFGG